MKKVNKGAELRKGKERASLASAHPQPKRGVWCWSVHLSPPLAAGCGLCFLPSTWLAGGAGVSRPPRGGLSLQTCCWVVQVTQELDPSACLTRIVHLPAASSLGTLWGPAGQGLQKTLDGVPVLQAVSVCLIRDTQQTEKTIRRQLGPAGKCRLR